MIHSRYMKLLGHQNIILLLLLLSPLFCFAQSIGEADGEKLGRNAIPNFEELPAELQEFMTEVYEPVNEQPRLQASGMIQSGTRSLQVNTHKGKFGAQGEALRRS